VLRTALVALNQVGYQSLALGYLRAYAESRPGLPEKVAFQTLDLTVDLDPWWVAYRVLGMGPDVVGFSVACWNAEKVLEAVRVIKRAEPDTIIVLGGPEVSAVAEEVLAETPEVTAVVRGEGEETFAELLGALADDADIRQVAGVSVRVGDEIVSAPDRPLIEDLDTIPSPYKAGVLRPIDGGSYLETYRGCPFRCGYCFEGKGYGKVRFFSEGRVEEDIALVASAPGVSSFSFIDPVFNLTGARLEWLSSTLRPHAERGLTLHTIEVDIERIDDEAAALLRAAGVVSVETGPQSVGEKALEICRRDLDPGRFVDGVAALKRAGVGVECDLIVGLPGDDVYDFVAGLRFVVELDPGKLQSSTLHVLPGTDLWARAEELGLRFDRKAPHEVIATDTASYSDLRRAEIMSLALMTAYRARV
jgi:anaerobic magnesium-protoporphyrin IX monomethyl ester cyclase